MFMNAGPEKSRKYPIKVRKLDWYWLIKVARFCKAVRVLPTPPIQALDVRNTSIRLSMN